MSIEKGRALRRTGLRLAAGAGVIATGATLIWGGYHEQKSVNDYAKATAIEAPPFPGNPLLDPALTPHEKHNANVLSAAGSRQAGEEYHALEVGFDAGGLAVDASLLVAVIGTRMERRNAPAPPQPVAAAGSPPVPR